MTNLAVKGAASHNQASLTNRESPPAASLAPSTTPPKPKLLDQVRLALRVRHYSRRTEDVYVMWIKRFIFFHQVRHPAEMGEPEINQFLTDLIRTIQELLGHSDLNTTMIYPPRRIKQRRARRAQSSRHALKWRCPIMQNGLYRTKSLANTAEGLPQFSYDKLFNDQRILAPEVPNWTLDYAEGIVWIKRLCRAV